MAIRRRRPRWCSLSRRSESQDGLKENTRKAIKNLDAAVVASKQPGYFKYHEPSAHVKKIESGDLLRKKLAEIKRVEKQIAHLKEQLARAHDESKEHDRARAAASGGKQIHTLKQVRAWCPARVWPRRAL